MENRIALDDLLRQSDAYEEIEPGMFVLKGAESFPQEPYIYTVKLVSKMNQWIFNPEQDGPKAIMDGEEVVMYLDEVPHEIAAKVVELQNAGKTPAEIDAFLLNNEGCTQDSREFIMEQINSYLALSSGEPLTPTSSSSPSSTSGPAAPAVETLTKQQKAAITRKANAANRAPKGTPAANGQKKNGSNIKDSIKDMEDKIALLKLLDSAPVIEIPAGLARAGRELMIEYQKEQDALNQKYIIRIQKM